jgi:hypothetical protein
METLWEFDRPLRVCHAASLNMGAPVGARQVMLLPAVASVEAENVKFFHAFL